MNKEKIKELRAKAKGLDPVMRLGKNGLQEHQITDLKNMLKKRRLIKIKMLKGYLENRDKKEEAKNIAEKLNAEVIEQVGFVFTVYR